jgi:hypothetical protein
LQYPHQLKIPCKHTNKEGQELCACQEARNIYVGTVHNKHWKKHSMHWKKHETVRLGCDNFPQEKIKEMGERLERLSSGGTVIDIHETKTIIMWQG